MTWATRPCKVVARDCEAPANGPTSTRSTCWRCGEPVCKAEGCSALSKRKGRLRRVCAECAEDMVEEEARRRKAEAARAAGLLTQVSKVAEGRDGRASWALELVLCESTDSAGLPCQVVGLRTTVKVDGLEGSWVDTTLLSRKR